MSVYWHDRQKRRQALTLVRAGVQKYTRSRSWGRPVDVDYH